MITATQRSNLSISTTIPKNDTLILHTLYYVGWGNVGYRKASSFVVLWQMIESLQKTDLWYVPWCERSRYGLLIVRVKICLQSTSDIIWSILGRTLCLMEHIHLGEVAANTFQLKRGRASGSYAIGGVRAWTLIIPPLSDTCWVGMTTLRWDERTSWILRFNWANCAIIVEGNVPAIHNSKHVGRTATVATGMCPQTSASLIITVIVHWIINIRIEIWWGYREWTTSM